MKRKQYNKFIRDIESNSKFQEKLKKIFVLNKKDKSKVNDNLIKLVSDPKMILTAYGNLQANKGSMTEGTDPKDTVDGFNHILIEKICSSLRNGTYKWKDIKKVEIPKPGKKSLRPLGLPNFSDKLVQEAIRIMLNVIYEPIFQEYEVSHGCRSRKRCPKCNTQIKSGRTRYGICIKRRHKRSIS